MATDTDGGALDNPAESRDKIEVPINTKGYGTSLDAVSNDRSHLNADIVSAGTYYIIRSERGAYLISEDPTGSGLNWWINIQDNELNKRLSNSTVKNGQNVDPSNTNTLSGYYTESQAAMKKKELPYTMVEHTCYIKNLLTGTTIELHIPEGLNDNINSNFSGIDIRGRSNAIQGYDSSGPREISFSLEVHEDYLEYGLINTVAMLKALCYPNYSGYVEAPVCYIKMGNAVSGQFIITSVGVDYKLPYKDDMFVAADISISATEAGNIVYSASEIESAAGMTHQ